MMEDPSLYKALIDNLYDGVYFVDRQRRITYWNRGAERITGYGASEVMGIRCSDNLLVHIDEEGLSLCKGLCPLARTMADLIPREIEAYLHHKDGHRVPVSIRATPILDENGETTGAVEVFSDNSSREALRQRVEDLQRTALLDTLTGLGNRRYIEQNLAARLDEMRRYGNRFGVLFMDIDHFKSINDTHGHDVGDRVLKMIAKTVSGNLRPFDILGRWGGEEFVAVVANLDAEQLERISNRFRFLVEESGLSCDGEWIRCTISIGGTMCLPEDSVEGLIRRADQLMYESKTLGRNRVTLG